MALGGHKIKESAVMANSFRIRDFAEEVRSDAGTACPFVKPELIYGR